MGLIVDAFYDIDLSAQRPVRSISLQSSNSLAMSFAQTKGERRTQKLGHVPQPTGIAAASKINKPPVYTLFDVMRTLPIEYISPSTRGQVNAMSHELRFPPGAT